jgi:hypothetical protein
MTTYTITRLERLEAAGYCPVERHTALSAAEAVEIRRNWQAQYKGTLFSVVSRESSGEQA